MKKISKNFNGFRTVSTQSAALFKTFSTNVLKSRIYAIKPQAANKSICICSAPSPASIPSVNSANNAISQNSKSKTAFVFSLRLKTRRIS